MHARSATSHEPRSDVVAAVVSCHRAGNKALNAHLLVKHRMTCLVAWKMLAFLHQVHEVVGMKKEQQSHQMLAACTKLSKLVSC